MKRLALVGFLTLCACEPVKLENFPRPFACDHNGGDGGQQCADRWSCGFDDRCFRKNLVEDGGLRIAEWECANETHCPNGWQCGVEVDGVRRCQQVGVGAPSPCALADGGADAGGCQGGWRCGADERCFNPSVADGGTTRECTVDEQCPFLFRCGQLVEDRGQHCIEENVNAPSDCTSDEGCEGTWRCDTFEQRCVEVPDAITTGHTTTLGATELSPRRHEDAPLFFAMTRRSAVLGPTPEVSTQPRDGVLSAFVFADGGLRVSAQYADERRGFDGGVRLLFEKTYPLPGGVTDVVELAVASEGPAVRFRDGGASRLWLGDGGWQALPFRVGLLRQRDSFDPRGPGELVFVSGNTVHLDGRPPAPFPGGVHEVIAERDGLYAFTDAGSFFVGPDGGRALTRGPDGPIIFAGPSRGAAAGYVQQPMKPRALALFADLPRPGGGRGVVSITEGEFDWSDSSVLAGCPDGGSPLQLAIGLEEQGLRERLITRCAALPPPASFPVQVTFRIGFTEFRGQIEDQTPFQWGVVAQRAGPFVRAHASTNGRLWYATDLDGRALLAGEKLHPQLLDRQPEAMLSFFDVATQSIRVFAQASGDIFTDDPFGGFVSQLKQPPISPLTIISSRGWIIGTTGLLAIEGGLPRAIATIAGGASFAPPTTGVAVQLQLGGSLRDVVLIASGDSIWFADVTEAVSGVFAQPAVLNRVLVPVPGVPLRSMALEPSPPGSVRGYFTTSTGNFRFGTTDLVRWTQSAVPAPSAAPLPLEVWSEADGGQGRTGYTDGVVWSLPIMVPLTQPLAARDGGTLTAHDFGRKCGDLFAATGEGLFRAERVADGGLPAWREVPLAVALESTESLRLFETVDDVDRLFIATRTGQVVEVTGSCQ